MLTYGSRLEHALQIRGITSSTLCRYLGISRQAYYRIRNGDNKEFNVQNHEKTVHFLNIDGHWLAFGQRSDGKDTFEPIPTNPKDSSALESALATLQHELEKKAAQSDPVTSQILDLLAPLTKDERIELLGAAKALIKSTATTPKSNDVAA